MSQKKSFLLFLLIASVVGAAAIFFLCQDKNSTPPVAVDDVKPPLVELEQKQQVTIQGSIACLPKKGNGAQTAECAIGLKGKDGDFYELSNLFQLDPGYQYSKMGTEVEVVGELTPAADASGKYDTKGTIDLSNITNLSDRPTTETDSEEMEEVESAVLESGTIEADEL